MSTINDVTAAAATTEERTSLSRRNPLPLTEDGAGVTAAGWDRPAGSAQGWVQPWSTSAEGRRGTGRLRDVWVWAAGVRQRAPGDW